MGEFKWGEYANLKDIVKRASEISGYSEEEMEEFYYEALKLMIAMMEDPDICSIYIRKVGRIYLNFNWLIWRKRSGRTAMISDTIQRMIDKMDRHFDDLPKWTEHFTKNPLKNPYFTEGRSMKQLEEFQNDKNK